MAKQLNLLLVGKPSLSGYSKEYSGQVSVDESYKRWCSDGLEFKCFNGEHVSKTFVLDCCDREVISFVAKNTGLDGSRTSFIGSKQTFWIG